MKTAVKTVASRDGTAIAYESMGSGPAVVLIGGAFSTRGTVAGLAHALAGRGLTAIAYDRRGRGDSGDAAAYDVAREVEDLGAVIDRAGGRARVFGHSSGAVLALEAAMRGLPVDKVVVYEPPYVVAEEGPRPAPDLAERLTALVALGRRDAAAALFLTEATGLTEDMMAGMRASEWWASLVVLAHTLPYDVTLCGRGSPLPAERLARLACPVLAVHGGDTPRWLAAATEAVAERVPGARREVLDGQDHGVLHHPEVLAAVISGYLA